MTHPVTIDALLERTEPGVYVAHEGTPVLVAWVDALGVENPSLYAVREHEEPWARWFFWRRWGRAAWAPSRFQGGGRWWPS